MIKLESVLELLRLELEDDDCITVMMDAGEARAIVDALDRAESQRDEVAMTLDDARRDGADKIRAERARADALLAACDGLYEAAMDCNDPGWHAAWREQIDAAKAAIEQAKGES